MAVLSDSKAKITDTQNVSVFVKVFILGDKVDL